MSYESDLPMGKDTIASQPQALPQVQAQPRVQMRAPRAQPPTYQLTQPQQPYAQPAQPYYQQPAPQMYAPPQPQYYAPPAYQQPYMPPQPQYYAPPQQYQVPQPQYYAPPQQYQAPPPLQYYVPPQQYNQQADPYAPVPLGSTNNPSNAPPPSAKPRGKPPKRSAFLALFPFGIGQFQNSQPLKGALFAVSEAGCLIGAVAIMFQVRPYQEKISNADPDYDIDQLTAFVQKQKTTQTILYGAAGALWLIGVIDAFVNLSTPASQALNVIDDTGSKRISYSYRLGIGVAQEQPSLQLDLKF